MHSVTHSIYQPMPPPPPPPPPQNLHELEVEDKSVIHIQDPETSKYLSVTNLHSTNSGITLRENPELWESFELMRNDEGFSLKNKSGEYLSNDMKFRPHMCAWEKYDIEVRMVQVEGRDTGLSQIAIKAQMPHKQYLGCSGSGVYCIIFYTIRLYCSHYIVLHCIELYCIIILYYIILYNRKKEHWGSGKSHSIGTLHLRKFLPF